MQSEPETDHVAGDASRPEGIQWPTVVFWMVCFTLNAMAQPCGKVLGLSNRHKAVLRSSPILYACDAVNAMASLAAIKIFSTPKTSFRKAAARVLGDRLLDSEGLPNIQTIKRIKDQSRIRWVGFALGVLPQYIKLYASQGLLIPQTIGAMYLVPWLLFELLVLMVQLEDNSSPEIESLAALPTGVTTTRKIWAFMAIMADIAVYSIPTSLIMPPVVMTTSGISSSWLVTLLVAFGFSCPLWTDIGELLALVLNPNPSQGPSALCWALFKFWLCSQVFMPGPIVLLAEIWPSTFAEAEVGLVLAVFRAMSVDVTLELIVVATICFAARYTQRDTLTSIIRALMLVIQSLTFYVSIFDQAAIYQPGWLRWLGK